MSIQELHTVATNIKGKAIRKLDIYNSRTAQLINNNLQEMLDAPPGVRRNPGNIDSEFDMNILLPIGLNERLFRINPNLLANGNKGLFLLLKIKSIIKLIFFLDISNQVLDDYVLDEVAAIAQDERQNLEAPLAEDDEEGDEEGDGEESE